MFHRMSVFPLLLLLLLLPPRAAGAEVRHALRVDTVAHGVKLSLIVPRSVYPRGVLTRVTVRVQNLSNRPVLVLSGCANAFDNPQVYSLTPEGIVRYPPAVPTIKGGPRTPACTGAGPLIRGLLAPGTARQAKVLVILGASRLRAVIALTPGGASDRAGHPFTLVGRTLHVRLVEAPKVRIVPCAAAYACLHVLPPFGARVSGPLYYAYSWKCEDAYGNVSSSQGPLLEPMADPTLRIGCSALLTELHVAAGWLNQPVGRLDRVVSSKADGMEG